MSKVDNGYHRGKSLLTEHEQKVVDETVQNHDFARTANLAYCGNDAAGSDRVHLHSNELLQISDADDGHVVPAAGALGRDGCSGIGPVETIVDPFVFEPPCPCQTEVVVTICWCLVL